MSTELETTAPEAVPVNKNKKHRKPKPWDDGTVDHWKIEPVRFLGAGVFEEAEIYRYGLYSVVCFVCFLSLYRSPPTPRYPPRSRRARSPPCSQSRTAHCLIPVRTSFLFFFTFFVSFTFFTRYREKYLREVWPLVTR